MIFKSINCLVSILDNTFFGTLAAGFLLAIISLFIYRQQKELDLKVQYNDNLESIFKSLIHRLDKAMLFLTQLSDIDNEQNIVSRLIKNHPIRNNLIIDYKKKVVSLCNEIDSLFYELEELIVFDKNKGFIKDALIDSSQAMFILRGSVDIISSLDKKEKEEMLKELGEKVSSVKTGLSAVLGEIK